MPNRRPATTFRPMSARFPDSGTLTRNAAVTESRAQAANICYDLRNGQLLGMSFDARTQALEQRDRRWTRELVYGMLRHRGWLDAMLDDRVHGGLAQIDADLTDLLRLGAYQLLFMGSVPAYAAIAQTVELAKRRHGIGASKLTNAILRRIDRERETLKVATPSDPASALAQEFSHPEWIVARWIARFGPVETRELLRANNDEAPLIARPFQVVREQLEAMFESAGVETADAPLVSDSVALIGGVNAITELGAFRQGLFFMQDPAATLVTRYACVATGSTIVDLCAAPGGKTFELSRTAGLVIACDVSALRMRNLTDNIVRLETGNVMRVVADAAKPPVAHVDAVLVDAPCTGTGTFRRHPDARWRLRTSDLAVMSALQRRILSSAADIVRPGGLLIYSTCSLEPEENEQQAERFLAGHPDFSLEAPPAGVVSENVLDGGFLRVLPQRHGTDGAFAARFRRSRNKELV